MVNENNELIIELWSRLKSHIAPKERLEVADIMIVVFDEFGDDGALCVILGVLCSLIEVGHYA